MSISIQQNHTYSQASDKAVSPSQEKKNWFALFATEGRENLTPDEVETVYSVFCDDELSDAEFSAIYKALSALIPLESYIDNALKARNEKFILRLIKSGSVDVEKEGAALQGKALQAGCFQVAEEIQTLFVLDGKKGPDGKYVKEMQKTLIANALQDGNEEKALRLLNQNVLDLKTCGYQLLSIACKTGCINIVQYLLERTDLNAAYEGIMPPLQAAICAPEGKSIIIVRLLLEKGVKVNVRNDLGETSLMHLVSMTSARLETLEILQMLLDVGADINNVNQEKKSCLDLADDAEFIEFFIARGINKDLIFKALINAIKEKKIDKVSLLAKHVNIYEFKGEKRSPYQLALDHNDPAIIAALLNISKEKAKSIISEYRKNFFVGHVNSVDHLESYNYETSHAASMMAKLTKALETLPKELSTHISVKDKETLIQAYKEPEFDLEEIQKGKLSIRPIGFKEHTMYLVFCNGYMAICNRGAGAPQTRSFFSGLHTESIKAFKIDLNLLTDDILDHLTALSHKDSKQAIKYYYETLPKLLSPGNKPVRDQVCKQLESISPKAQKIGNCSFTQAKLGARVASAMLKIEKDDKGVAHLSAKDVKESKAFSKDLSSHIRLAALDSYLKKHDKEDFHIPLVTTVYGKIRKRFFRIPQIALYPAFNKWKAKLEEIWWNDKDAKLGLTSLMEA